MSTANIHTIGDARRVAQSFYSLERQRLLTTHGVAVSKISPNSSEILDGPVPTARDAATACRLAVIRSAVGPAGSF